MVMSEQAIKNSAPSSTPPNLGRMWHAHASRPGEKVVSFSASSEGNGSGDGASGSLPQREWASAIELVREASEAIRISEERAVELENQLRNIVDQAEGEMQALQQKLAAQQQAMSQLEERARRAEARAKEAETWLIRLYDAVFTAFGSRSKANVMEFNVSAEENN